MDTFHMLDTLKMAVARADGVIQELNQRGSKAFSEGKYDQVRVIADQVRGVIAFRKKLAEAAKDWIAVFPDSVQVIHEPDPKPIRIVSNDLNADRSQVAFMVTQGSLNHNYLRIGDHKRFFPADSYGPGNKDQGMGKLLKLHAQGIAGIIETDIDSEHTFFRNRSFCAEFFRRHSLQEGDSVIFEKISEYEYKVYPHKKVR